ncbi:hypothetical protein V5O48_016486 [Marasmius crinis-equi]|uniref:Uncharacterized protein n=1 Tax=Marasmius crinis-equi TaxID=585013 RepID=A0ABR3ERR4_9AGAR
MRRAQLELQRLKSAMRERSPEQILWETPSLTCSSPSSFTTQSYSDYSETETVFADSLPPEETTFYQHNA